MALNLDEHNHINFEEIRATMLASLSNAHNQTAVTKRISVIATAQCNRGRQAVNGCSARLVDGRNKMDEAVFAAYDWPSALTDAEILGCCSPFNRQREAR